MNRSACGLRAWPWFWGAFVPWASGTWRVQAMCGGSVAPACLGLRAVLGPYGHGAFWRVSGGRAGRPSSLVSAFVSWGVPTVGPLCHGAFVPCQILFPRPGTHPVLLSCSCCDLVPIRLASSCNHSFSQAHFHWQVAARAGCATLCSKIIGTNITVLLVAACLKGWWPFHAPEAPTLGPLATVHLPQSPQMP